MIATKPKLTDRETIKFMLLESGFYDFRESKKSIYIGNKRLAFNDLGQVITIYDYDSHVVATSSGTRALYK